MIRFLCVTVAFFDAWVWGMDNAHPNHVVEVGLLRPRCVHELVLDEGSLTDRGVSYSGVSKSSWGKVVLRFPGNVGDDEATFVLTLSLEKRATERDRTLSVHVTQEEDDVRVELVRRYDELESGQRATSDLYAAELLDDEDGEGEWMALAETSGIRLKLSDEPIVPSDSDAIESALILRLLDAIQGKVAAGFPGQKVELLEPEVTIRNLESTVLTLKGKRAELDTGSVIAEVRIPLRVR